MLGSMLNYVYHASPRDWNAPISVFGGPLFTHLVSNAYSNKIQREYYEYQKQGYERQLADWYKYEGNPQGTTIRYPELSYPGQIRGLDKSISQSYANDASNIASFQRSAGLAVAGGYRSARSLYARSAGRSSRYL